MTAITPEKLAELEKLEAAATPGPWGDCINGYEVCGPTVDNVNYAIANKALLPALRNNARALFAALREAWRERDEYKADLRLAECYLAEIVELVGEGGDGTAFGSVESMLEDKYELQKECDEARAALDQLRTSVLSIAAQIDRAADARAAAVLIGQPPSGAATVYDLRAFAGDLRRAVETPRDSDA